jgi:biopolymer transport protein TolQ
MEQRPGCVRREVPGGSGVDHPFISTLTRAGFVGQVVLLGLLVLSIYTWAVIFTKSRLLKRAERACRSFLEDFREEGIEGIAGRHLHKIPATGPLEKIFVGGLAEFRRQREIAGPRGVPGPEARERIEGALDAEIVDRVAELEKGHLVLAIAASSSPFIGLFGTVWGIMIAFHGMSLEGSAGIAAVAPGVADALVTTVAGLAVAIPAVIAFNVLNRRVQLITSLLDRFANEFLVECDRMWKASAAQSGVGLEKESKEPVFARRPI